jgi:hypothetical protein
LLCGHTTKIVALEACNPNDAYQPNEHIASNNYASTIKTRFYSDYYNKSGKTFISDVFPTPSGTQMKIQTENSGRVKSRGTPLGSQHFGGVEGRAGTLGLE